MAARRSPTKKLLIGAAIAVGVASGCILASRFVPMLRVAENWVADLRVVTLAPTPSESSDIVVVVVTEDTLATFPYRAPVDRRFLSELIGELQHKRARLIGLDVLLDQPTEPGKDRELARRLRGSTVPVVVASADAIHGLTERQSEFLERYLAGMRKGIASVIADPADGVVRAVPLTVGAGQSRSLGFAAAVAEADGAMLPDDDTMMIDFRGVSEDQASAFPAYPAESVALLPDAWFAGKIVLIGADLTLVDRHRTPFSLADGDGRDTMPGVLVHAHALSQLLEGRADRRVARWQKWLLITAAAGLGVSIVSLGIPFAAKLAGGGGLLGTVWIGGFGLYQLGGPLLSLVSPTLAFVVCAGMATAWLWRVEHEQKRFIRAAFAKFMAPAIVEQLVAEPDRLKLAGEQRELTFLFTDIAGFTSLVEQSDPETLVKVINGYLDRTCNVVLSHEGTIEKIVGDALHVMFNAPLDQPDHAERAIDCALALDAACREYAANLNAQGIAFGETRIGVNTGTTVVGNFGGETRFDYSAQGDAINVAARLESVNKHLGTRICVSETTASRCRHVQFRPVGRLLLKGKTTSVEAFEPLLDSEPGICRREDYLEAYQLLESQGAAARTAFEELARRHPGDALVAFHHRRLVDGVVGVTFVLREK